MEQFPYTVQFAVGAQRLATRVLGLAQNMAPLPGIPARLWQREEITIVLAPSEQAFHQLTGGRAPEWGAGVAIPQQSLIILPAYGSTNRGGPLDYGIVLRHELAHLALQRALAPARLPRWFNEGYATWAAGQLNWENAWMLRAAFLTGRAPPLDSLDVEWIGGAGEARIAYLLAASFIEFLVAESGQEGLRVLFEKWRATASFDRALAETYGADLGQLESQWRKFVKQRYGWAVFLTQGFIFFAIVGGLVIILVVVRRRRDRKKLAALKAEEPPDNPAFWQEGGVEIIAHRGFSARAPENTIAAMELALRYGATALEFDIHATRDGVPVVIHDATLERTTNGQGRIAHKTNDELRALDAGSWFSPLYIDERIPTLDDVLRFTFNRANRLYIELKPGGFTAAQLEVVAERLVHYEFVERSVLMSFDWGLLDDLRALPPPFTLAFLADDEATFLLALDRAAADGKALVDCNYRILLANPALAERAHQMGIELAVYTVNDTVPAEALVKQGVRRLTTNEVERLLKWARGVG